MIDYDTALKLVTEYLSDHWVIEDDCFIILEDKVIERDFGWVFLHESRNFIESGDYADMLLGNAPIIVDKYDKTLHVTGTVEPLEVYIENYRNNRCQLD